MTLPELSNYVPCFQCKQTGCCVAYRVGVTGADIFRLVKARALAPEDFSLLQRVHPDRAGPDTLYLGSRGQGYELTLQKRAKSKRAKQHPCVFLMDVDKGFRRCGVYEPRPMVCRMFPTVATYRGVHVQNRDVCPDGSWSIERVDLTTAQLLHSLWRVERDIYHGFVRRWNRHAATAPGGARYRTGYFFHWLLTFYGSIDPEMSVQFADTASQTRLVTSWFAANDLGEPPFDSVSSELHDELVAAYGTNWPFVAHIRRVFDELEQLTAQREQEVLTPVQAENETSDDVGQTMAPETEGASSTKPTADTPAAKAEPEAETSGVGAKSVT